MICAGVIARAGFPQRPQCLATGIILLVFFAVTAYLHMLFLAERVDHAHAYAVQTARYLVSSAAELSARMQNGHSHLHGRNTVLFVNIHRNTASVVPYGYRIVGMQRNLDFRAVARQCLIYTVVHKLRHQVMQTPLIR